MGFLSNFIENKALKVFSRQAAGFFSTLSNDEAAMSLVCAVDMAVKMAESDDADYRAMARIILDPQSGSSNDCLYIYDIILSVYAAAEKSTKQTIKRLDNRGDFYKAKINSMLMGYRIIMFLMAERAEKAGLDDVRVFYTKMTLCATDDILTRALNDFREQLIFESKSGLFQENLPTIPDDSVLDFYKTSIELWSMTGRFSFL